MPFNLKVILIALGTIAALGILISFTLHYYIGGFISRIAEEEREEADERNSRKD